MRPAGGVGRDETQYWTIARALDLILPPAAILIERYLYGSAFPEPIKVYNWLGQLCSDTCRFAVAVGILRRDLALDETVHGSCNEWMAKVG
ncbi:MAG: hypothetical protein ABJL67_14890 [Sulfitobacter sp.]